MEVGGGEQNLFTKDFYLWKNTVGHTIFLELLIIKSTIM